MAESEFTYKTFLWIVMAVADVIFPFSIFVVAMFFDKLLLQMPERVERLEQYRKQYDSAAKELDDVLFHPAKVNDSCLKWVIKKLFCLFFCRVFWGWA